MKIKTYKIIAGFTIAIVLVCLAAEIGRQRRVMRRLFPYSFSLTVQDTHTGEIVTNYSLGYARHYPEIPTSGGLLSDKGATRFIRGIGVESATFTVHAEGYRARQVLITRDTGDKVTVQLEQDEIAQQDKR